MKKNTNTAPSTRPAVQLTTEALTSKFRKKPNTARASLCRHGHWMGMIPIKLPSGRLLWDEAEADALLSGLPVEADPEKIGQHFERKAADASKVPAHLRAKAEKRLTSGEGAK